LWRAIANVICRSAAERGTSKKQPDRDDNAKIARWTKLIGIGTIIAAIVAVLAAVIFGRQLQAMLHANQDARESFIAGNRAFVFVHSFEADGITDGANQVIGWNIRVIFENTSNTPTRKLVVLINSEFNKTDPPQDEFPPDVSGEIKSALAVIRPHATSITGDINLTLDQIQQILDGQTKFFIWGWAEYNDIFEKTPCHRTRFMDELKVVGNFRRVKQPGEGDALRFVVVGRFNDPDDHCTHARP
jgi:hypothetical protein